jgi:rubrerythrin
LDRPPTRGTLPPLHDTQSHAHLRASFIHDAEASRLSERFARIAEIEGFPEIARTFRDLAESQAFMAQGHLDLLMRAGDPISGRRTGDTMDNVRAALAAHDGELLDPLPDMVSAARAEGFPDIASWFESLAHARRAHRQRLAALLGEESR